MMVKYGVLCDLCGKGSNDYENLCGLCEDCGKELCKECEESTLHELFDEPEGKFYSRYLNCKTKENE